MSSSSSEDFGSTFSETCELDLRETMSRSDTLPRDLDGLVRSGRSLCMFNLDWLGRRKRSDAIAFLRSAAFSDSSLYPPESVASSLPFLPR